MSISGNLTAAGGLDLGDYDSGSTVMVSGGDFPDGSTATVYLDHAGGTPLGSVKAGILGSFTTSITMPAGQLLGSHRIVTVDGTITASAPIKVT